MKSLIKIFWGKISYPRILVTGNRIISLNFRGLKSNKQFLIKKGGFTFPFLQNPKNKTKPSLRSLNRYRVIEAYKLPIRISY